MLKYSLYNNHFTENDPDDRLARPVDVKVNSREDLIEEITGPGSILKPTESNAVINSYWRTISDYISRGESYSDEYIKTRLGITGVFQNDDDQFDAVRHAVVPSAVLKEAVTAAAAEIQLQKVDGVRIAPEIEHIYDWGSQTTDDVLTPGERAGNYR